ncbi:hypothetical protein CEXT_132711 [Caerostris extrusa]|uniref:Uncharacterized protein n=1 Tax=Caerostris extrusa TaxID=172846 RepID=A0AAV4TSH8_CAEEX|nr:hypothetical protein CEXT_132711 [Caerostris extrusa]
MTGKFAQPALTKRKVASNTAIITTQDNKVIAANVCSQFEEKQIGQKEPDSQSKSIENDNLFLQETLPPSAHATLPDLNIRSYPDE